jgi:hypothetical protein
MVGVLPRLAAILVLVLLARPVPARDLLVPSQYQTIQKAIDAAVPFDRIRVAAGTYRERIALKGFPLLIESVSGPERTVIDGGGTGPVVTFHPQDTSLVMLRGFTVTGGLVTGDTARGAGIHCGPASPVIVENIVCLNHTQGVKVSQGAGLFATGTPIVANNEFRDNSAAATDRDADLSGAGLYVTGGLIHGNRITGNTLVSGADIRVKVTRLRGAGAFVGGATQFVRNNVTGNYCGFNGHEAYGGGVYLSGTPVVALNRILNNTAAAFHGRGGGICCAAGSRPVVTGNAVIENYAQGEWNTKDSGQGGGIFCEATSTPVITYDTVRGNRTGGGSGRGAGIAAGGASPSIVGCIFWQNNHYQDGRDLEPSSLDGVSSPAVRFCLIGDGQFIGQNGNFRADPRFRTAYHLDVDSPCIDVGEPGRPTAAPGVDLDGSDRVLDGRGDGAWRVDVGADEFGALRRLNRRSVRPGRAVPMKLTVPRLRHHVHLCAASFGTAGIPIPEPEGHMLPLTYDPLFAMSFLQNAPPFSNFTGLLDANGEATIELTLPPAPGLTGITIYVAGFVVDSRFVPRLVTNAVALEIES